MRKIFTYLTIFSGCFSAAFAQNVGVGTTIPVAKLEVSAPDSNAAMITNAQPATYQNKTRLYFRNGIYYTGAIGTEVTTETPNAPFAKLSFFTYGSSNASGLLERMTISDGGLVGINNVDPVATLDIAGTFKLKNGSEGPGKVLTSDALGNAVWQNIPAATSLVLPYTGTFAGNTTNIFGINNTGTSATAPAIYGSTASTAVGSGSSTFGPAGVVGEVTPTAPGGFSTGVKGINRGTAGNGIGVLGYQAGSGFGVYGSTVSGTGIVGASTSGTGGSFSTTTGTALSVTAPSTGTALAVNGDLQLTGMNEGLGRVLTSDGQGYASWQTPPSGGASTAFSAYLTSNTSLTNNTVLTGFSEYFDEGNNFNPSTGTYTVPVAGIYMFKANASFSATGASGNIAYLSRIRVSYNGGGTRSEQATVIQPTIAGYGATSQCIGIVKCNAGDLVVMEAGHSFGSSLTLFGGTSGGNTQFSGVRIY